jgi:hypothetical protein
MKSIRIASVAVLVLTASFASAQIKRTFVSAQLGNDANTCVPTSPCRNFLRAITAVDPGGEVIVLDSGGYGPFTVAKPVTVQAPTGVYAGCTAPTGAAVTINTLSGDTVILRGLFLNGLGTGSTGIDFSAGGVLHVENVVINGFASSGILVSHSSSLFINDTTIRNGGNAGIAASSAVVSLSRSRLEKNTGPGLYITAGANIVATESVAAGNSSGFAADSATTTSLTLENCVASGNGTGVTANAAGANVRVSNSTITNNTTGVSATAGAALLSRSNNLVEGNVTDGTFSGTFAAK